MDQLLAEPGATHFVLRLSAVEIHSVFAKKVRIGAITPADYALLAKRFRGDVVRKRFRIVRITSPHFQAAERLLRSLAAANNLRTLDSLQLAVALSLRDKGLVERFVCADRALCAIARAEGLTVINPEIP